VPEAAGKVQVAPDAIFRFMVRPACEAAVIVVSAAIETIDPEPLIKPAVDVTGPEKVVEAI
jgi:hypothetical protein